jgi:hypothetical protein
VRRAARIELTLPAKRRLSWRAGFWPGGLGEYSGESNVEYTLLEAGDQDLAWLRARQITPARSNAASG